MAPALHFRRRRERIAKIRRTFVAMFLLTTRGCRRVRSWPVVLLMIALTLVPGTAASNGSTASGPVEYRIKSAYLFNFTKFVDWPATAFASPDAPFAIAILSDNPADPDTRAIVAALDGKQSGDRAIEVRVFERVEPSLARHHLVFLTRSSRDALAEVRTAIGSRPVLIVGESEGFAQQGGTINLAVLGDTVRCEINLRQAERTGLKLSGRLASVARLVREEPAP